MTKEKAMEYVLCDMNIGDIEHAYKIHVKKPKKNASRSTMEQALIEFYTTE